MQRMMVFETYRIYQYNSYKLANISQWIWNELTINTKTTDLSKADIFEMSAMDVSQYGLCVGEERKTSGSSRLPFAFKWSSAMTSSSVSNSKLCSIVCIPSQPLQKVGKDHNQIHHHSR